MSQEVKKKTSKGNIAFALWSALAWPFVVINRKVYSAEFK